MSTTNDVPYPLREHCTKDVWVNSEQFREALLVVIRERIASRIKADIDLGDLVLIRSLLTNKDLKIT